MKKQLKYLEIEYTHKDLSYIDDIENILDEISEEIINFFGIEDFDKKIKVHLFDNLEVFKEKYLYFQRMLKRDAKYEDWICGFAHDDEDIYVLCLEEHRKTNGHENDDVQSLAHLILHEFTHSAHHKVGDINNGYYWLTEGLACVLSHQYDNYTYQKPFDITLSELCDGNIDYNYYRTMVVYVLNTYGKDYILKLINNYDFLASETPRLYEETKIFYT